MCTTSYCAFYTDKTCFQNRKALQNHMSTYHRAEIEIATKGLNFSVHRSSSYADLVIYKTDWLF